MSHKKLSEQILNELQLAFAGGGFPRPEGYYEGAEHGFDAARRQAAGLARQHEERECVWEKDINASGHEILLTGCGHDVPAKEWKALSRVQGEMLCHRCGARIKIKEVVG